MTKQLLSISVLASLAVGWPIAQGATPVSSIRRLDGTTIPVAEAEAFARKTLDAARVTGAQIAVLDRGQLV
jgi:hypothetical protein